MQHALQESQCCWRDLRWTFENELVQVELIFCVAAFFLVI
jgi:hypothetical protein